MFTSEPNIIYGLITSVLWCNFIICLAIVGVIAYFIEVFFNVSGFTMVDLPVSVSTWF